MGVDPMVSRRENGTPKHYHKGLNSVFNVKVVVTAFNQEKALVGAFSLIVKTDCEIGIVCSTVSSVDREEIRGRNTN